MCFWGGGEKLQLENAMAFVKKQYNVFVFANSRAPLWQKARAQNIDTRPISINNLSFLNPFVIWKLVCLFREANIDTVVFTTSHDVKVGSLAAKVAGVKNIVYQRGLAVPIKKSLINKIVFRSILTHIIANSQETKRSILCNLGAYVPEDKVQVVYHGIEEPAMRVDLHEKLPEIAEKAHGVILGNAGRLTAQKGQVHLITIAKTLKEQQIDFTLFIAGTGELEDELRKSIVENDLHENVILLGFVEDVDFFMRSIDIFLLTSIWEGFGFVLVEAMIRAVPVVCFNASSNPEIVSDNKTGYTVDYPDIKCFVDKTILLIEDEQRRKQMGLQARKSVCDRFLIEDRISEFEAAIRN